MAQKQLTDFFNYAKQASSSFEDSHKMRSALCFAISPRRSIRRKRKLITVDDLTQMTLDAGQRRIGTQCCAKCGMVYDIDSVKDRREHDEYHNRFSTTNWFRVRFTQIDNWKRDLCFAFVEGGYIFNIKASTECSLRKRLEEIVLQCVNKELGYTMDLADVWDKKGLREAWIFISDIEREYPFIAGVLLVDAVKKATKLLNQNMKDEPSCKSPCEVRGSLMGVNRVWVHPCMRRKGIAMHLLETARAHFLGYGCLPRERVAFSDPTIDGLAFATNFSKQVLVYNLDDIL